MAKVNWSKGRELQARGPGGGIKKGPGTYLAYAREAEDGTSKAGDPMIVVTLHEVGTDAKLCRDWLMLDGEGCGIGTAKLIAFGLTEEKSEHVGAEDILGRKVYVRLVEKPSSKMKDDGTPFKNLTPDMNAGDGWSCGYRSVDDPPAGAPTVPTAAKKDDGEEPPF